jgi:predicted O-methyltransferase YrrM
MSGRRVSQADHDAAWCLRLMGPHPLLDQLKRDDRTQGNILNTGDRGATPLITIAHYVVLTGARSFLETGTQKGFFGYFLSRLLGDDFDLVTCDCDERSRRAVELLQSKPFALGHVEFILGDSKETLPKVTRKFDLAWIDGGHDYATALSDIQQAIRLEIPCILIDDTLSGFRQIEVGKAVDDCAELWARYDVIDPTSYAVDEAGLIAAVKKGG